MKFPFREGRSNRILNTQIKTFKRVCFLGEEVQLSWRCSDGAMVKWPKASVPLSICFEIEKELTNIEIFG